MSTIVIVEDAPERRDLLRGYGRLGLTADG
jgi:hypothetical protein